MDNLFFKGIETRFGEPILKFTYIMLVHSASSAGRVRISIRTFSRMLELPSDAALRNVKILQQMGHLKILKGSTTHLLDINLATNRIEV